MEAFLSVSQCGLPEAACDEIKHTFLKYFPKISLSEEAEEQILSLLRFDKKNAHGRILFSLLEDIGIARTDQEVTAELLHASFDYYRE